MRDSRPLLAITMGDPAGIGPEITIKALAEEEIYRLCRPLVVGDLERLQQSLAFISKPLKINEIASAVEGIYAYGTVDVLPVENPGAAQAEYGKVSAVAGKAAVSYIFNAIDLAMANQVHGVVTGPINKEAINAGGYHYPGHTEIFAEKTGTKDYSMMLATDDLYVLHVSTHCSLREACDRATKRRVGTVLRLAQEVADTLKLPNRVIGVSGLNPHAGEGGMFGREEIEEIIPAIEEARSQGMEIMGPLPPDTVFVRAAKGQFSVVVVMYHDQGHIPVKVLNFEEGVNITVGLPIIRTSVDHGTAFGKAGKGTADARSMLAAIKIGAKMAKAKFGL
ncbi:MAG: 4-hydroxythreonine-4-phosphate dehydrogenase PdxA [Bacillota bacterium]